MPLPSGTRGTLFIVFAALGVVAAGYHVTGMFYKIDTAPVWRHLLFAVISLFCVYGILKRPSWFIWFFGVLLVQQYYSHGLYLFTLWREQQKIHWISVLVLILLPIVLLCLVDEYRARKQH